MGAVRWPAAVEVCEVNSGAEAGLAGAVESGVAGESGWSVKSGCEEDFPAITEIGNAEMEAAVGTIFALTGTYLLIIDFCLA